MSIVGWYYLHENGDMIFKRAMSGSVADFRESEFVKAFWSINTEDRSDAWTILVEGLSSGANRERIEELARLWGCDDQDAINYANFIGIKLFRDGVYWCATRRDFVNLQESIAGFGEVALYAIADLCTNLGYAPQKLWGEGFRDLCTKQLNSKK